MLVYCLAKNYIFWTVLYRGNYISSVFIIIYNNGIVHSSSIASEITHFMDSGNDYE